MIHRRLTADLFKNWNLEELREYEQFLLNKEQTAGDIHTLTILQGFIETLQQ